MFFMRAQARVPTPRCFCWLLAHLHEAAFSRLVVLPRGHQRQVGKTAEFGIGAVEQVVNAGASAIAEVSCGVLHFVQVLHFRDPSVVDDDKEEKSE